MHFSFIIILRGSALVRFNWLRGYAFGLIVALGNSVLAKFRCCFGMHMSYLPEIWEVQLWLNLGGFDDFLQKSSFILDPSSSPLWESVGVLFGQ